jgi:hypothetical protein
MRLPDPAMTAPVAPSPVSVVSLVTCDRPGAVRMHDEDFDALIGVRSRQVARRPEDEPLTVVAHGHALDRIFEESDLLAGAGRRVHRKICSTVPRVRSELVGR